MVAEERYASRPREDVVIGAEVACPEEALLTEFDGVGDEEEQGHPNGHLDNHGQAAAHRADAVLRIDLHLLLLHLHGVCRVGVLLLYFVEMRLEGAHLGRRHELLTGERQDNHFHNEGEQQQHDAHVHAPACEEVEEGYDDVAVNEADYRPAHIDELVELQVLTIGGELTGSLQRLKVVGSDVELEA